jgi:hypothetical protein
MAIAPVCQRQYQPYRAVRQQTNRLGFARKSHRDWGASASVQNDPGFFASLRMTQRSGRAKTRMCRMPWLSSLCHSERSEESRRTLLRPAPGYANGPGCSTSNVISCNFRSVRIDFSAASRVCSNSRSIHGVIFSISFSGESAGPISAFAIRHLSATFSIPSARSRLRVSTIESGVCSGGRAFTSA